AARLHARPAETLDRADPIGDAARALGHRSTSAARPPRWGPRPPPCRRSKGCAASWSPTACRPTWWSPPRSPARPRRWTPPPPPASTSPPCSTPATDGPPWWPRRCADDAHRGAGRDRGPVRVGAVGDHQPAALHLLAERGADLLGRPAGIAGAQRRLPGHQG